MGLMEALVTVAKTTLVVAVAVELAVAVAMVLEVVVVLAVQAVNLLLQEQPLTTLAVVVELEIMVEQVVEQVAEAMLTNLELPILEAVVVAIILAVVQASSFFPYQHQHILELLQEVLWLLFLALIPSYNLTLAEPIRLNYVWFLSHCRCPLCRSRSSI